MTFEIKDVCDGWAMDLKAELALAGEDGEIHRLGWSQVSWESKDGKRYRYFTRELSDSEETSRRRGEVRRDTPDGPADVIADLPRQAGIQAAGPYHVSGAAYPGADQRRCGRRELCAGQSVRRVGRQ